MLLLDEPTTGCDPASRRLVWALLRPAAAPRAPEERGPAVLLSTHYMDEAEALATCVGIVVAGEMRAAGSVARLTERYGAYTAVEATCRTPAAADIGLIGAGLRTAASSRLSPRLVGRAAAAAFAGRRSRMSPQSWAVRIAAA